VGVLFSRHQTALAVAKASAIQLTEQSRQSAIILFRLNMTEISLPSHLLEPPALAGACVPSSSSAVPVNTHLSQLLGKDHGPEQAAHLERLINTFIQRRQELLRCAPVIALPTATPSVSGPVRLLSSLAFLHAFNLMILSLGRRRRRACKRPKRARAVQTNRRAFMAPHALARARIPKMYANNCMLQCSCLFELGFECVSLICGPIWRILPCPGPLPCLPVPYSPFFISW
jgi:hypothetical protein